MIITLVGFSWLVNVVQAVTMFNNAIEEEPNVECGRGTISVRVKTTTQKPSYIFAKGHFRKDGCMFNHTDVATFQFDSCNINRKREINPRGMAYSLTVIVQLHPLFITKVDRAYNVRCFYMEDNREVGAELQVSDLTTSLLESGHAMPQCSYSLHRDSPNGPVLRYARVGDVVFHVWDCPSDVYAMLVHTCYILDGQGGQHQVIDTAGCSTDDFIIPQLTYSNELTRSFTGASVVNLPDRDSVYFSCQVKLCFKRGDYCTNVTPPRCGDDNSEQRIEQVLDNEQLLQTTTAGVLATSKILRIVTTKTPLSDIDSSQSSQAPEQIFTKNVTIRIISEERLKSEQSNVSPSPPSVAKYTTESARPSVGFFSVDNETSLQLASAARNLPKQTAYMNFDGRQNISSVEDLLFTAEGSGEEDISLTTISAEVPNPTRERRTVGEDGYNLVDLDVSTPQLKILDETIDAPELPAKQSSLNGRREGICISMLSVWVLSGASLVSISIAVAALTYLRLSNRNMALFYRY